MKNSLVKSRIKTFDYSRGIVIFYKIISESRKIRITNMNLEDLSIREMEIQNETNIVFAEIGVNFAILLA